MLWIFWWIYAESFWCEFKIIVTQPKYSQVCKNIQRTETSYNKIWNWSLIIRTFETKNFDNYSTRLVVRIPACRTMVDHSNPVTELLFYSWMLAWVYEPAFQIVSILTSSDASQYEARHPSALCVMDAFTIIPCILIWQQAGGSNSCQGFGNLWLQSH